MMKRFVSIVMVITMILAMFSVCASAMDRGYTDFRDYKSLLYDIHDNTGKYADGYGGTISNIERDRFAYADVNNDGIDELIVRFTDTYIAAQTMYVFTFDRENGQVYCLGTLLPYSAFYSSGYVKSDDSHNQGPGNAIWPYKVSRVDMDAMELVHIANAYCVETALIAGNSYYEETYGHYKDTDNDGVLYFFTFTDQEYYAEEKALTKDEFLAEKDRFIPDNLLITLDYHNITKSNIDKIEPDYGSDLSDAGSMIGDLNGDNKVTAADARFALRFASKLDTPTEVQAKLCDVDGNGKITAADARKILRVAAKLDEFE